MPGQPPAPLRRVEGDRFALAGLPEGFSLAIVRDAKRRPKGLVLTQPNGVMKLVLVGTTTPGIDLARLLEKRAAAHGSAALAKHRSLRIDSDVALVNQGLRATSTVVRAAGDRWIEDVHLLAFGREIGRVRTGFAGTAWELLSFAAPAPVDPWTAKALALEAIFDPYGKNTFATASVLRSGTVAGRPVVVARFTTEWGAVITDSYDASRMLLVERALELPVDDHGGKLRETRRYSDWRKHAGIMIPHRIETDSVQGKVIATVTKVALDVPVDDATFARPKD